MFLNEHPKMENFSVFNKSPSKLQPNLEMEPRNFNLVYVATLLLTMNIILAECDYHFEDYSSSEEDTSSGCRTIWGTDGTCKTLRECPPDQWSGSHRDICFRGRYQKIVCCQNHKHKHPESHRPPRNDNTDRTREKLNGVSGDEKKNKDNKGMRISEQKFEEYMNKIFDNTTSEPNIQGRTPTRPGEYPHMSALGWILETDEIDWKCGGNLISDFFVLTAAHCVSVNGKTPDLVKIGDLNLVEREDTVFPQTFRVIKTYIHPMYDSAAYYNDIGLIELNRKAIFTEFVRPACLWSKPEIPHDNVVAMGYGSTEFGGVQTKTLTELKLTIMNNTECNSRLPPIPAASLGVIESQICAIDPSGRTDTCQGDSGGPLQMNAMKHGRPYYYLIGITSYGIFCGGKYPSVYTRIPSFVEWIENIVWPF